MDPREDSPFYEFIADTLAHLLPKAVEYGISGAAELDIASIAKRMRTEMNAVGYAMLVAPMVCAWCTKAA